LKSDSISTADKNNYLKPALNSLRIQSFLINDIIDFTQFYSNLLIIEPILFTIEALIEEIDELFN